MAFSKTYKSPIFSSEHAYLDKQEISPDDVGKGVFMSDVKSLNSLANMYCIVYKIKSLPSSLINFGYSFDNLYNLY